MWWILTAAAEAPIDPVELDPEVVRYPRERDWPAMERRSRGSADAALVCTSVGVGVLVGGLHAERWSDRDYGDAVSIGAVLGGASAVWAVGASLRMNRALREQGVVAPTHAGAFGWGLAGLGATVLVPLYLTSEPVGPAVIAGVATLGAVQVDVNERARRRAGLKPLRQVSIRPHGSGVALAGTF
jgi:hypothetical protein